MSYLENEIVIQPWEQQSRRLTSWFEMLNVSAEAFYYFGRALRDVRIDCFIGSARCLSGDDRPAFVMISPLDDRAREQALKSLAYVEEQSRKLGMQITAETVTELIEKLKNEPKHNFQWLFDQTESIEGLARKELKDRAFFYISPEKIAFWPKAKEPFAFGRRVADSFPSSTYDVNGAGICLACSQPTAAVFHLMRVLEIGLTELGKAFGVSLTHTNWAPAIEQIESRIRDMHKDPIWKAKPDRKEYQEFYAQAASHFAILKDAWRNHAMHVRGKYTDDEAESIFETVKAFMQKLAERLDENLISVPPVTP